MRGRKLPRPKQLVERLTGDAQGKERLEVILDTVAGHKRVTEASAVLGITPQRFHVLRQQVLQGALAALAPQPVGRPRRTTTPAQEQIDALQRELQNLRRQLDAGQARLEVVTLLPGRHGRVEKKRGAAATARQRSRR